MLTGSWANSSASKVCLLLPAFSALLYLVWIKTVVLTGRRNVSDDRSLLASRLWGRHLSNPRFLALIQFGRATFNLQILLNFTYWNYTLKYYLDDWNRLDLSDFAQSEPCRLTSVILSAGVYCVWTVSAVSHHSWVVSESDYTNISRKEPEPLRSAAHNSPRPKRKHMDSDHRHNCISCVCWNCREK